MSTLFREADLGVLQQATSLLEEISVDIADRQPDPDWTDEELKVYVAIKDATQATSLARTQLWAFLSRQARMNETS